MQQPDLKALAARTLARIERNSACNNPATGGGKPCNKRATNEPPLCNTISEDQVVALAHLETMQAHQEQNLKSRGIARVRLSDLRRACRFGELEFSNVLHELEGSGAIIRESGYARIPARDKVA